MRLVELGIRTGRPLVCAAIACALLAVVAPSPAGADESGPNLVRVELGAALSLRADDPRDHFGFGGGLEYERRLGRFFGIGGRLTAIAFPYDEEIFDGSGWATYYAVGPSVRLHLTPGLRRGDLWIAGGGQVVLTGDLVRAGVDAALGFDIDLAGQTAIGPFVRYAHVFQPSGSQGGSTDGRILLFGLALRFGWAPSPDDVEDEDETTEPEEEPAADATGATDPATTTEGDTGTPTDEGVHTSPGDVPDDLGDVEETPEEPTVDPEPSGREPRVREPREPREPRVREPREPREPRVREPREPREPHVREPREPRAPRVREPREPRVREPREPRAPRVREPREPVRARPTSEVPNPETTVDTHRFHDPNGDRDVDGVRNGIDACPSLWGTGTDGCPVFDGRTFGVHMRFETDRAALTDETVRALLFILDKLRADPSIGTLEIVGHADRLGEETYNADLSLRRAESVLEWFLRRGMPRSRFVARGVGFSEPLVDGETSAELAPNRRVELFVVDSASP